MDTTENVTVMVINRAGKSGKSTLSKHLIAPKLRADWIQVETFNDSGHGATAKVAGRRFESPRFPWRPVGLSQAATAVTSRLEIKAAIR